MTGKEGQDRKLPWKTTADKVRFFKRNVICHTKCAFRSFQNCSQGSACKNEMLILDKIKAWQ
jgi:hypothetical protein